MASSIKRIILLYVPCVLGSIWFSGCSNEAQRTESALNQAQIAYDASAFGQAVTILEPLATSNPDNVDIHELLGKSYQRLGDYLGAAIILRETYTKDPARIHLAKDAAKSFAAAGDFTSAIAAYRKYLNIFRDDAHAMRGLADAWLVTGRDTPALEWLLLLEKSAPPLFTREYILETARIYRQSGLNVQAKRYYQRLESDEDLSYSLPAQLALIDLAARDQEWEKVKIRMAMVDKIAPGAFDASPVGALREQLAERERNLARLAEEQAKQEALAEEAREALISASTASETSETEAEQEITQPEPTEPEFAEVIESAPTVTPPADGDGIQVSALDDTLASTTTEVQEPETADLAIPDIDPSEPDSTAILTKPDVSSEDVTSDSLKTRSELISRGDTLLEQDDYEGAVNAYYDADARSPNDPIIWERISQVFLQQGSPRQGEIAMLEAMRHAPDDAELRIRYIRMIQGMGDPKKLMRVIESAKQRFPENAQITLLLARAFERIERNERVARFYYEQFLDLAPDSPEAESVRARLISR